MKIVTGSPSAGRLSAPDSHLRNPWSFINLSCFWFLAPPLGAMILFSFTRRGNFLADDYIILNQLTFKYPTFGDNLAWFGRDWGVGVDFYRPWIRLGYFFQFQLFGPNPAGWHLFSTFLHTLNSFLVFLLTWLLVKRPGIAALAGLFFAWHPIHSEPVAWISGQTDLWATFFCLASICSFIKARQQQVQNHNPAFFFLLAVVSFGLALFSKEAALTLPPVLLLHDLIFFRPVPNRNNNLPVASILKSWGRIFIFQLPFWLLLGAYFILRLLLFKGIGGYSPEAGKNFNPGFLAETYLRWLSFPFNFAGVDGVLLAALVLAFLGLLIFQELENRSNKSLPGVLEETGKETFSDPEIKKSPDYYLYLKTLIFGLGWAGVFLLPALLTPPAERFTYLPSAGFVLALAVCLTPTPSPDFISLARNSRTFFGRWFYATNLMRFGVIGLVLLAYSASTSVRVENWNQAGYTARNLLELTKSVIPGVVHYSVFTSQGVPESGQDSLIFRTGYPEAMQLLYMDPTVEAKRVGHFPIITTHLDRTIFLEYKGDRLINHTEVPKVLDERNANFKNEKVFKSWTFNENPGNGALQVPGPSNDNWLITRSGVQGEFFTGDISGLASKEVTLESPDIFLPAVQLGSLEIKITPPAGTALNETAPLKVSWGTFPMPPDRLLPPATLEIKMDGQPRLYRVNPPINDNYFYTEQIGRIKIVLPPSFEGVKIEFISQNSIPVNFVSLSP